MTRCVFSYLVVVFPNSKRVGTRPASTTEEKLEAITFFNYLLSSIEISQRLPSILMLVQGFSRFESSIQSLSQSVATITPKIASVEQIVGGLAARVAALEARAISASSVSGSAGSWPQLGQVEGSTATGVR